MKKTLIFLCFITLCVFLQIGNRLIVRAWQDNEGKYIICHCVKEHCETLHLPLIAANNHLKNHNGDYADECRRPSNTPTPTICRPTITPTIEATPTASPSATLAPTATPEAKLEPTQERHDDPLTNDTTHNSNPNCDTQKPGDVDNLSYFTGIPGDSTITLNWSLPLRAHTINLCYGRKEGLCEYGASGIPNSGSYDVKSLDNNQSYWFSVQGQDGCATGNWSTWIDPMP